MILTLKISPSPNDYWEKTQYSDVNFLCFLFTPAFSSKFEYSDSFVQGSFTSHCFADGVVTWFVLANCISATLARYKLFNSITWLTCADQDAAAALKQPLQNSCSAMHQNFPSVMQFFGIPSVNLYCYLMSQMWLLHLLCEINRKLWKNCCSLVVSLEINIHVGWFNIPNILGEMVGKEDLNLVQIADSRGKSLSTWSFITQG